MIWRQLAEKSASLKRRWWRHFRHYQTSPNRHRETIIKPLCQREDIQSSHTFLRRSTSKIRIQLCFQLQPNSTNRQPPKQETKEKNHLVPHLLIKKYPQTSEKTFSTPSGNIFQENPSSTKSSTKTPWKWVTVVCRTSNQSSVPTTERSWTQQTTNSKKEHAIALDRRHARWKKKCLKNVIYKATITTPEPDNTVKKYTACVRLPSKSVMRTIKSHSTTNGTKIPPRCQQSFGDLKTQTSIQSSPGE